MDGDFKYKISSIPVIYEDNWLLIVDKPQGLLSVPTPKKESRALTNILNEELRKKKTSYRLYPCHRLDRETSGLIIYAKGKSMQKKMMEAFKQRRIKKKYIAFVQGILTKNAAEIRSPIEGLSAQTRYKVIQRKKDFTLVEIQPLTGRTNQIRIHFKLIGHPVVGEKKFAFRRDFRLRANRLCLHAKTLEFVHPLTKGVITLDSELPLSMKHFLQKHPQ